MQYAPTIQNDAQTHFINYHHLTELKEILNSFEALVCL